MTPSPRSQSSLIAATGSAIAHGCLGLLLALTVPAPRTIPPSNLASSAPNDTAESRGFEAEHSIGEMDGAASASQANAAAAPGTVVQQALETTTRRAPNVLRHLWESTIVAAVVAVLALLLRRQGAHVRYGLWLAASVK